MLIAQGKDLASAVRARGGQHTVLHRLAENQSLALLWLRCGRERDRLGDAGTSGLLPARV